MHPSDSPAESVQPERFFQHLVCINNAAFVARFVVQRLIDGRLVSQTSGSPRFQAGEARGMDLTRLRFHGEPLHVGDQVRLRVGAAGGVRRNGPSVAYAPNGQTASFSVRGTTLVFSINQV